MDNEKLQTGTENGSYEQESGMNIKELWLIAKNNGLWIAIVTLACTIIGAIYGLCFKATTYKATSSAIVQTTFKDDQSPSQGYQSYLFGVYLINTYADFIVNTKVLAAACDSLKEANPTKYANITPNQIKKLTTVKTTEDSLIITITVSSGDEQFSIDVANALLDSTQIVANQKQQTNPDDYVYEVLANKFVEMDRASLVSASRGAGTVIIICFLVGLVASYAFFLVKYLLDDTYKSKNEFEDVTGLKIIAVIPDTKNTKNAAQGNITEAKMRG